MIISANVAKAFSKRQRPIMKKALSNAGIKWNFPTLKGYLFFFFLKPTVVIILHGESLKATVPLRAEQDKGVCSGG